jgi:hypothetical protein
MIAPVLYTPETIAGKFGYDGGKQFHSTANTK